jgi:hypothetical protein
MLPYKECLCDSFQSKLNNGIIKAEMKAKGHVEMMADQIIKKLTPVLLGRNVVLDACPPPPPPGLAETSQTQWYGLFVSGYSKTLIFAFLPLLSLIFLHLIYAQLPLVMMP